MGVTSVSEYVASLSEEQQRHINAFIEFMNVEFPQLTNKISFSMPMWLVGKKMYDGYVAVSAAKNHFSIHFSDEEFLNRLAESLPACKKEKQCINIKYGDEQSLRAVEESINDFLRYTSQITLKGARPYEWYRGNWLLWRVLQDLP